MRPLPFFLGLSLFATLPVYAGELASRALQAGDCAVFREGGNGRLLRTPSYWLRGRVVSVVSERRLAGRCPHVGKPQSAYTRADWARLAAASPCVDSDAAVREVDVLRISLRVDAWETPWSHQHGTTGWLFRGHFLDRLLKKDELIDMDAAWLEACEAAG